MIFLKIVVAIKNSHGSVTTASIALSGVNRCGHTIKKATIPERVQIMKSVLLVSFFFNTKIGVNNIVIAKRCIR